MVKNKPILIVSITVLILAFAYFFYLKNKLSKENNPQNYDEEIVKIESNFNVDSLYGYWMIIGLGEEEYSYINKNDPNYVFFSYLKYMPILYKKNGEKTETYSNSFNLTTLNWKLISNDTLVEYNDSIFRKYKIESFENSLIKLKYNFFNSESNVEESLFFTMCKIHPEWNSEKSLFCDELNIWRNRNKKIESEKEVKLKLKSLLAYNSIYLRSIFCSNYHAVNTRFLHLPFDYYRDGVLLKNRDDAENFSELFIDGNNVTYAYETLKEASSTIKYPKNKIKSDFILEYAMYFDSIQTRIK